MRQENLSIQLQLVKSYCYEIYQPADKRCIFQLPIMHRETQKAIKTSVTGIITSAKPYIHTKNVSPAIYVIW
jgi:hypothetical protein